MVKASELASDGADCSGGVVTTPPILLPRTVLDFPGGAGYAKNTKKQKKSGTAALCQILI